MRTTPDKIRAQIHRMILEKKVATKLTDTQRNVLFSLEDKSAQDNGGRKTLWGIWQTNSIPLGKAKDSVY